MSSGANDDPRCPECDEPVGVTATYCMHCGAEFEEPALDDSADVSDADDVSWGGSPDVAEESPDVGDSGGSGTASDGTASTPDVSGGTGGTSGDSAGTSGTPDVSEGGRSTMDRVVDGLRSGLGPDGFIDDSLTIVVGIVAGIVVGIGALIVAGIVTQSWVGVLLGLVAWLLSTIVIARQRTVLGAVRLACYSVAAILLLGPVIALSPATEIDGGIWSRIVLFLIGEVVVAIPALILAVVGFAAGKARPDSVVDDGTGTEASA